MWDRISVVQIKLPNVTSNGMCIVRSLRSGLLQQLTENSGYYIDQVIIIIIIVIIVVVVIITTCAKNRAPGRPGD
jgi:hypothetical protein